jgi:transcriptional regulator with XRE-family HTH domain
MPDQEALPSIAGPLGLAIRKRRLDLGLTQAQVAQLSAAIEPNYYGRLERGEKNISVSLLVAVARALETTASDLLRGLE